MYLKGIWREFVIREWQKGLEGSYNETTGFGCSGFSWLLSQAHVPSPHCPPLPLESSLGLLALLHHQHLHGFPPVSLGYQSEKNFLSEKKNSS